MQIYPMQKRDKAVKKSGTAGVLTSIGAVPPYRDS